jgi:hypothetical protein
MPYWQSCLFGMTPAERHVVGMLHSLARSIRRGRQPELAGPAGEWELRFQRILDGEEADFQLLAAEPAAEYPRPEPRAQS